MGYLYSLLGAVLFATNGSVTKVIVDSGLTGTQLTQIRVLGTALLAGGLLVLRNRAGFRMPWRQLVVMALLGVFGVAIMQASYAASVSRLPVGIALLIEYTSVLFVAVIGFVFFGQRVRNRLWIGIGLVLVGLAVVAQIWASRLDGLGVVFSLVCAASLTFYFLAGERLVHASSPISVTFFTMAAAAVFWAPLSGWWRIEAGDLGAHVSLTGNLAGVEAPLWALVAWNVVCGTFLPFLLSFLALGRLRATAAGIVASSEVLFAFVVAWLWLGETLGPVQLVGGSLVLAGIVLAQTSRITETGLAQPVDATMPPPVDPGLIGTSPIDVITGAIDVIRVEQTGAGGRDVGGRP